MLAVLADVVEPCRVSDTGVGGADMKGTWREVVIAGNEVERGVGNSREEVVQRREQASLQVREEESGAEARC